MRSQVGGSSGTQGMLLLVESNDEVCRISEKGERLRKTLPDQ